MRRKRSREEQNPHEQTQAFYQRPKELVLVSSPLHTEQESNQIIPSTMSTFTFNKEPEEKKRRMTNEHRN